MNLRARIREDRPILAPGISDPLTASIAAATGFEMLYLSGANIAYTRLGRPDIGLVSMNEVAEVIAQVRDRVETPFIVDADTGYGNALNVQRTMRLFERAGANALQFEDQTFPKRCGHLRDKSIVPSAEMVGKIKAAADARASEDTLIVARSDALAVEGMAATIDRAEAYAEAGADVLFIEAPASREDLAAVAARMAPVRPLIANMVEGGMTPNDNVDNLAALGFRIVIFPGGIVRAMARTARDYYASLHQNRTNAPFRDRMFDFNGLNELIGTPEMIALGERYQAPRTEPAGEEGA
ncbi:isocitrate lyase/PEP mutase family protein [Acuticoccus sp. MNP-M23]|uniref:isocitrate lyase/PEP mutase family protein n=1 Tax=Acuticoccus sp. MNP-M23 TaxID=3072793 RepID=UPI0028167607|nr:isocitrate lyase/PEP mutase family protein [Acuticoccus sp. MNP-M23]WMS42585.1 isocitrate lyase/PEP mutase family protein [Acuticoccus sp. MNP-M23]